MKSPIPGMETLLFDQKDILRKKRIGVICNQASLLTDFRHALDLLLQMHTDGWTEIKGVFGPQHGIWGHTQENMIEWEGYTDNRFPFPFYSLYGTHRDIPADLLDHFDLILFDLQDVGARYYTFIWTLTEVMKSLEGSHVELIVTDRPNPINGITIEGPVLEEEYRSFVGEYPLPVRHGMTIGELALYFRDHFFPKVQLTVIPVKHWKRDKYLDEYPAYPWIYPSPNMPKVSTALVYPGMCLLEGTNLSEGRGTTSPFEIFGAPFIDGYRLCEYLNTRINESVRFQYIVFQPTFHKFHQEICEGAFIHVTNRKTFRPFQTALEIIRYVLKEYPEQFRWKEPPYEYEYHKLPIDILLGNEWIRQGIESGVAPEELVREWQPSLQQFDQVRQKYLLY